MSSLYLQQQQQQNQPEQKLQQHGTNSGRTIMSSTDIFDMSRMRLTSLSPNFYMNKAALQCLLLAENHLECIPIELIDATPSLAIADFSFNSLARLPEAINRWRKLNVLKLDRNNLSIIPDTITELVELECLSLAGNLLTELPNLTQCPVLKCLSLLHNVHLPPFLTKIYTLLYPMSANQIYISGYCNVDSQMVAAMNPTATTGADQPLPSSKLPCQPLKVSGSLLEQSSGDGSGGASSSSSSKKNNRLNLESSGFTYFPFRLEATQLHKLRRLLLGYNSKIDYDRCHHQWTAFKSLKLLCLDHCQLAIFPLGLCGIVSLRRLSLKKNYILTIPKEIRSLYKLKRLDLSHNQIDFVPPEVSSLSSLKTLKLNNNNLKTTKAVENLARCDALEKLNLSHNFLTEYPRCFQGMKQIHCIRLDNNQIPFIPTTDHNDKAVSVSVLAQPTSPLPDVIVPTSPLPDVMSPRSPTSPNSFSKKPTKPLPKRPVTSPNSGGTPNLSQSSSSCITKSSSLHGTEDSSSISYLSCTTDAPPRMESTGLIGRVRSFTYCSSNDLKAKDEHKVLTPTSSIGSLYDDDPAPTDVTSNYLDINNNRHSQLSSPRQTKEKRSITKLTTDFIKDMAHFRKKSNSSPSKITSPYHPDSPTLSPMASPRFDTEQKRTSYPLQTSTSQTLYPPPIRHPEQSVSLVSPSVLEQHIDSSPSIFDDPNISNSVNNNNTANSNNSYHSREYSLKSRSYSFGNLDLNSSSSLPMNSILAETTKEYDSLKSTGSPNPNRKSPPTGDVQALSISSKPPTTATAAIDAQIKQLKVEFTEEIFFDDKSLGASYAKRRLAGLLIPTKVNNMVGGSLLSPTLSIHQKKTSSESSSPSTLSVSKKKSKKKTSSDLDVAIKESPSLTNIAGSAQTSAILEGDDFIRDLMSSPVWNQEIEFTSEDGVPKIKTATVKMLVCVLTHERGFSKELENGFFDTYTLFTTVEVVIQLLQERFYQTGKNNSPTIKQKVLRFVEKWVDRNWEDFSIANINNLLDFCKSCQETVEQGMTTTYSLKNQITTLYNIIRMKRDGTYISVDYQDSWEQPAPIPDFTYQENFTLLDVKPHEIARQLSMIDHGLFGKITKKELLEYVQSQSNPPASIVSFTNRFNYVSRWVASEITTCPSLEKRIMLIFKFINIAINCWILKNFNSATAIIAGLKHGAVSRLKTTWFYVNNSKASVILQEFEELISPTNLTKLRKVMDAVEAPSVPYLGSYFNHLVGITEGNKSTKCDQINLLKYEMIGKILAKVHHFQSKAYNLTSVGVLHVFLNNLPQLTESQLYDSVGKMSDSHQLAIDSNVGGTGTANSTKLWIKKRKGSTSTSSTTTQ
ncbi:hypothetical protein SAMD00019534_043860 [Acytostelium subglobosum LB1]|uniref:hypothetical protein n=1 Tax=Acytostelium subglobosum LB1 TaxID=1410327 RepID=UPI000644C2D6|nr:hypothetical protein SAMD00019534_043860 [Acytostelium subglobosum LB1]GAM21211.1 hypothetical protein SAMD00019534_043860 [Acytostelium subglobosum LB1]|eukprot:XP_012756345.1 hypothetical protein SAMD00019534_043860 [Acytostelium subglobosum LB1]